MFFVVVSFLFTCLFVTVVRSLLEVLNCPFIKQGDHYAPVRKAKVQNTDNTKCPTQCGVTGILILSGWECKIKQLFWKTVWQFLTKLNLVLPYDPATSLLRLY